jgi:DNA-binding MarR family transcriptional regulator
MKVQDCIFFQLTKASQSGIGFWTNQVKHLGVTASQAMVLNFLGEEDGILSRTLGQKLRISSATMTGILDRLEKIMLIERRPHPSDRRANLIFLTEQGHRYAKEINTIMVKANREYMSLFSSKKAEGFRNILKILGEAD